MSNRKQINLQVQLGGSKIYRVGKGDTSSMLVVDAGLWERAQAAARRRASSGRCPG